MSIRPKIANTDPAMTNRSASTLFFTSDGRVDWVDVAKGICILFVVMMHSTLGVEKLFDQTSWMGTIVAWAQPFRMPDFFFIAGLFLVRSIDAPWRRFLDRKIVHFFYFYLLWMVIQAALKGGFATGDQAAIPGLILMSLYEPFGTLWFIYMLPIFFLTVRLTRKVPVWLMLMIGAALEIAPISTGLLLVDEFAARFVYFYAGYALAGHAFGLASHATARPVLATGLLLVWGVVNGFAVFTTVDVLGQTHQISHLPVLSLILGGLGALAVVTGAALITHSLAGRVFSFMGASSIVIYLAFFLPMILMREGAVRLGWTSDVGMLSLLTTLVAVAGPLGAYWLIRRWGVGRFLFERPAWARLDTGAKRTPPSLAAVQ